jgi:hypothetical protein
MILFVQCNLIVQSANGQPTVSPTVVLMFGYTLRVDTKHITSIECILSIFTLSCLEFLSAAGGSRRCRFSIPLNVGAGGLLRWGHVLSPRQFLRYYCVGTLIRSTMNRSLLNMWIVGSEVVSASI